MDLLAKITRPKGVLGLEFGADYAGFAFKGPAGKQLSISASQLDADAVTDEGWCDLVASFVAKHNLQNYRCNIVMPASDYQMLLVERPDVADEELREAVKWRVKDLISSSIDSVVVDIFELPSDANKAGKKMLYAVVAELSRVQFFIELAKQADLKLENIDIEVLTLRNLTLLKDVPRGAAVVRLRPGAGDVSIYKNGSLYLSRHFKLDFGGGLLDDLPEDALALEVQRSFDYVERQMGQVPPGVLFVCGEGIGAEKITETLQRSLPCPIELLDVSAEIGIDQEHVDESMFQICVAALGAVYREEVA